MRILPIALLLLMLFGCAQKPAESGNLPPSASSYGNYSDGFLSFQYPAWPDAAKTEQNFLVKNNGSCTFAAARYPGLPSRFFKDYLNKNMNGSFSGAESEYFDFILSDSTASLQARARIVYCNYDTYSITVACAGSLPDAEAGILDSASCARRNLTVVPRLALIPVPANDNPAAIVPAIKESRENGVDVLDWYFDWKGLDGNWTAADYIMEPISYEGRSAAMVEVIHTNVLAKYPERFTSFDDPGFKEQFANFSAEFVSRYKPDYYFVGSEVDDYLWNHRDKLPAFKELLHETREKVKEANPQTKFGFTMTYHDAIAHNATDIAKELSDEADIIAYTSYGYEGLFQFSNVSRGIAYLEGVKNVVPGKPYAIIETGWSSSALLNSSEEKQAEFAEKYFRFVNSTDAEYVKWWGLNDGKNCTEPAKSFLTDMPWLENDTTFMISFKEYICSLALKRSDGTPKKAWYVWQENT